MKEPRGQRTNPFELPKTMTSMWHRHLVLLCLVVSRRLNYLPRKPENPLQHLPDLSGYILLEENSSKDFFVPSFSRQHMCGEHIHGTVHSQIFQIESVLERIWYRMYAVLTRNRCTSLNLKNLAMKCYSVNVDV